MDMLEAYTSFYQNHLTLKESICRQKICVSANPERWHGCGREREDISQEKHEVRNTGEQTSKQDKLKNSECTQQIRSEWECAIELRWQWLPTQFLSPEIEVQ